MESLAEETGTDVIPTEGSGSITERFRPRLNVLHERYLDDTYWHNLQLNCDRLSYFMLEKSILVNQDNKLSFMRLLPAMVWAFKDDNAEYQSQGHAFLFFKKLVMYNNRCTQMKMVYLANVRHDFRGALDVYYGSIINTGNVFKNHSDMAKAPLQFNHIQSDFASTCKVLSATNPVTDC